MRLKVFMSEKVANMYCRMANDVSNEHTASHIRGTRRSYFLRLMALWATGKCSECHRAENFSIKQSILILKKYETFYGCGFLYGYV
jgi:hypothetical protein